jgi:hypothetical protein
MGVPLPRPAALAARLEIPIEEWPYLDEGVLLKTRSRKACTTCHWFRRHGGVNCIPLLTCQLNEELIAHGEHLTSRCQGWADELVRQNGWAPELVGGTWTKPACLAADRCRRPLAGPKPTFLISIRQSAIPLCWNPPTCCCWPAR